MWTYYTEGTINTEHYYFEGVDSILTWRYKKDILVEKKVHFRGLYLYNIKYYKNGDIKRIKEIYQPPENRSKPREFPK